MKSLKTSMRSAFRGAAMPDGWGVNIGFRLALSPE